MGTTRPRSTSPNGRGTSPSRSTTPSSSASVHVGKHQPDVLAFVEGNRERLAAMPTAFFQVSLSSADENGREQAASYVDSFVERTGWHPDWIDLFGGALRFSEYGFLTRLAIKRIAKANFPDVDPSEDVEFTDWTEVEAFANDVAAFVEGDVSARPHRVRPLSGRRGP